MNAFQVNSVLIVKMDHIGDMVLTTPVFRAVKKRYPDCFLGVVCSAKGKQVLLNSPFVDEVYEYNPNMFDRENKNDAVTKMSDFNSVLQVRSRKYDVCISFREDYQNTVIQKILGARYNISFSSVDLPYPELLSYMIPNPGEMHMAEKNFELLKLIDVAKPEILETELFTTENDYIWAEMFWKQQNLSAEDKVIGIIPGGGWFLNWWQWEKYARLCEMLIEHDSRIKILLVGGDAEREVIRKIKGKCSYRLIETGRATLQQLVEIFKRVALVICNDGGIMHVASAAHIPIVALFGPSPKSFYPVGDKNTIIHKQFSCSPCPQFKPDEKPRCLNNRCMKAIRAKEVFNEAVKLLE